MAMWPEVEAVPGAKETLEALASEYRLAIATNATVSSRPMITSALERAGIAAPISDIFCFTEIGAKKDTEAFWKCVADRLEAAPEEIAMVGDSLEQDVLGPRRFGVFSIWFNEDGKREGPHEGVPIIHRLADLPALLQGRSGKPPE
ncbi:MAG: HAD family hydrolase [Candidatus Eisenbacteria bacterium]